MHDKSQYLIHFERKFSVFAVTASLTAGTKNRLVSEVNKDRAETMPKRTVGTRSSIPTSFVPATCCDGECVWGACLVGWAAGLWGSWMVSWVLHVGWVGGSAETDSLVET
jgi:hypothetical protein